MYLISSFYPDSKSLSLCMQHAASCIMHHADHFLFLLVVSSHYVLYYLHFTTLLTTFTIDLCTGLSGVRMYYM